MLLNKIDSSTVCSSYIGPPVLVLSYMTITSSSLSPVTLLLFAPTSSWLSLSSLFSDESVPILLFSFASFKKLSDLANLSALSKPASGSHSSSVSDAMGYSCKCVSSKYVCPDSLWHGSALSPLSPPFGLRFLGITPVAFFLRRRRTGRRCRFVTTGLNRGVPLLLLSSEAAYMYSSAEEMLLLMLIPSSDDV